MGAQSIRATAGGVQRGSLGGNGPDTTPTALAHREPRAPAEAFSPSDEAICDSRPRSRPLPAMAQPQSVPGAREEFEALPLDQRIKALIGKKLKFYKGGVEVNTKEALLSR